MWDLLSQPVVQAVLAVAFLLVALMVGYQVLVGLRPSTCKADTSVEELAHNFEEMRHDGEIDDQELRKIKAVLGKTQETRPG